MKCNQSFEYISTYEDWLACANFLKTADKIAVDLEANGMYVYFEKICLLQFAANGKSFIVEPEIIGDGLALAEILQNPKIEKTFHSCDYDVRSLNRDFNIKMENVFDTSIAAQFLGSERLGLGNVINEFLTIELEKSKKIQQMNWGMRPLPSKALKYAVDDVLYLEDLRDLLVKKLSELGRLDWVLEECSRMLSLKATLPLPATEAYKNVKGRHKLTGEQLAVFREIFIIRDNIAHEKNRPAFKIMHNSLLMDLAKNPNTNVRDIKGMNPGVLAKYGHLIRAGLDRGMASDPIIIKSERVKSPWRNASLKRLNKLKAWRSDQAQSLSLAASVIWPMASLERLALAPDNHEEEVLHNSNARNWQKKVFSAKLLALDIWD